MRKIILIALLATLPLSGCGEADDIRVYTVPRAVVTTVADKDSAKTQAPPGATTPETTDNANTPRLLAAIVPRDGAVWHFKLMGQNSLVKAERDAFVKFIETMKFVAAKTKDGEDTVEPKWELPKGWTHKPGTGMRFATITVGEAAHEVVLTVFRLGPESGDIVPNVERWAAQVGVKDKSEKELKAMTKAIKVDGKEATLVDVTGIAGAPATPRPRPVEPAKVERVTAKTPEGWTQNEKPPQFILTQYDFKKDDKSVTLTISSAGGDIEANLNRWRSQVGLKAWDEEAIKKAFEDKKEIKQAEIATRNALIIDLAGEGENKERILGALTAGQNGAIWFFKMRGPAELVESQRAAFETFLKSVKFEE